MRASKRQLALGGLAVVASMIFAGHLAGFYLENKVAWSGSVTMQLQLGPSGQLLDGSADWDASAIDALEMWNQYLKAPVLFKFVRNSTAAIKKNDKVNNVFYADDIYGEPFPAGTAAVTLLRWNGSKMSDADVVFNKAYKFDAYRGPARGNVLDFRRVALHEFGHVLGLSHPDVAGQSVSSIMNSYVSDTDEPQSDDAEGVQSVYGRVELRSVPSTGSALAASDVSARTGFVGFPAFEDTVAFGAALDAKFRDGLHRRASVTFVDPSSVALWTQEYLRYRVQACSHAGAVERTFMQLDGLGVQPVCGTAAYAVMPDRSELFDFRTLLEAKFRDEVKTHASSTHVDAPADAAWLQEYLRYRLGECSHDDASARVLDQLDGHGVAPICR